LIQVIQTENNTTKNSEIEEEKKVEEQDSNTSAFSKDSAEDYKVS